jgi:formylglycine-generating enzyme required for sulfatase activity
MSPRPTPQALARSSFEFARRTSRSSKPSRADLGARTVRALGASASSACAFAALASAACALPALATAAENPPGTVFVPGGRTKIGIELKELERLLGADVHSQSYAGSLSAETPRHEVVVDSFWLGATEVTNEQYAAYVRATGSRPPEHWAEAAVRIAREAYFKELEHLKTEALAAGLPVPDPAPFDAHEWWFANWRGAPWEIPPGDAHRPVVFVDYQDARNYAHWAGLRLPTEFEYQRAVRGDTERTYPWGNEWDSEKYAATSLMKKKSGAFAVGSFPAGASKQGAFDLAGNVWEWTSSPYISFPGYERKVFEFGFATQKRQVNAVADFNAEQRVVVGGSFQNSNLMARGTARRPAGKNQSTDALGFRCAASARPGVDMATWVLDEELTPNVRPREQEMMIAYASDATVGIDEWVTAPIDVSENGKQWSPPPSYAVIGAHHYAIFTPVKALRASEMKTMEQEFANEGPVALGFLSTDWRMLEPALKPGTYMVSYRPKGVRRATPPDAASTGAKKPDGSSSLDDLLRIDINFDHLIFTDLASKPVLAVPTKMEYGQLHDGTVRLADSEEVPQTNAPASEKKTKFVMFDLSIPCRVSRRGYSFALTLKVAE